MQFFSDLWLPIFLISIVLFFASYLAWMVLPHHFGDWNKLDKENELMDAINRWNVPAGNYMFPGPGSQKERSSEEYMARYKKGPRGVISVWNMPSMQTNLVLTFVFFFITTSIIGYITHVACPPGATTIDFMKVFRIAGAIGILTHASSGVLNSVWFKRRIVSDFVDGIAYGLLIGLIFAWLWPYA